MKFFFSILIVCITGVGCSVSNFDKIKKRNYQSYSLDAYNSDNKIYFGKDTIFSDENYRDKSVLVIIENKRMFAKDIESVLDTLNIKYKYYLISQRDSIMRYSNLKTIQKILVIE